MTVPINVFTTFSESGYKEYGKRWLESMETNWPEANLTIYTDFDLQINNVKVIDFNTCFPHHQDFKHKILEKFKNKGHKGPGIGQKTVKFSYKAFCIAHELQINKAGFTIWSDGDVQVIRPVNIDFYSLLENKFLACQLENVNKNNLHIESGILFFNSYMNQTAKFGELLYNFYNTDKLFTIKKPYDGYVIAKILHQHNMPYVDLNADFNVKNKRSLKEETFLHPILNQHFVHWIGNDKNIESDLFTV